MKPSFGFEYGKGIVYGHYKLEEMVKMSVSILIGRNLNVIQLCTAGATCGRDTFQPLCSVEAGDNSNTGFSTNHFQVTPGPELGMSSSYGEVPAPHLFLRLVSEFLFSISFSILLISIENL